MVTSEDVRCGQCRDHCDCRYYSALLAHPVPHFSSAGLLQYAFSGIPRSSLKQVLYLSKRWQQESSANLPVEELVAVTGFLVCHIPQVRRDCRSSHTDERTTALAADIYHRAPGAIIFALAQRAGLRAAILNRLVSYCYEPYRPWLFL